MLMIQIHNNSENVQVLFKYISLAYYTYWITACHVLSHYEKHELRAGMLSSSDILSITVMTKV